MDPTDLSPNFINPAYATPEQVAQLREYAKLLQSGAIAPDSAKHWTGALAQGLMGLGGQLGMNQANQLQRQLLAQGQQGIQQAAARNPYAGALFGNPSQPQANSGVGSGALSLAAEPLKSSILMQESGNNPNIRPSVSGAVGPGQIMPETFKQFAKAGEDINNPQTNRDVSGRIIETYMGQYGDPARAAVAYFSGPGNVAPPGSPTPWKRDIADPNGKTVSSYVSDVMGRGRQQVAQAGGDLSGFYMNPSIPQGLKENVLKGTTPVPVEDVYGQPGVRHGVMGGVGPVPVDPRFKPGFRAPATVGPEGGISSTIVHPVPGSGEANSSIGGQLRELYQTGQEFAQQSTANAAIRGGIADDLKFTQAAIPIMQNLDLMVDDVRRHGDEMTFGPSAELATNIKKVIAQYAPGMMTEKEIAGLASQDSLRKQTAMLATAIGRSAGNTDLSLLQGRESVPGEHNTKEGLLALADMIKQQVGLAVRFQMENYSNYGKPGFNPLVAKAEFYKNNPIINPITRNPITVDLAKGEKGAPSQLKSLSDEDLKKKLGL